MHRYKKCKAVWFFEKYGKNLKIKINSKFVIEFSIFKIFKKKYESHLNLMLLQLYTFRHI